MTRVTRTQCSIPRGWAIATIAGICDVNPREAVLRDLPEGLEVTFVPMAAVDADQGTIAFPGERTLGEVRRGFTPFRDGDVVVAKITPCMENGKAAVARGLRNGLGFGSTEFHVLRPPAEVLPEWIFHFVRQSSFREEAKAHFSGAVGQQRVPASFIQNHPVPLAPLAEQRRTVAEIEKQLSRLDTAVAALKRAQANLRRYRASVLRAACEGRLVPQDPEDEPAQQAVVKAVAEHANSRFTKVGQATPITSSEDIRGLPGLPLAWCWVALDEVLGELRNGFFGGAPNEGPPGVPILRISAVRPGKVSLGARRYLGEERSPRIWEYELKDGDLLFTRYNGSRDLVGACGMIRGVTNRMIYPDKLIRVRTLSAVLPAYLEAYFGTDVARRQIERLAKTTAGQYGIAGADLRSVLIPLPPLREQHRVVPEIERLLSVADQLGESVASNLKRAARLRQAILKRAFEGRLVPQDPSDEPASILLERIREERKVASAEGRSTLRAATRRRSERGGLAVR